jgi:type VI secretion system secreted protein Hcp
MSDLQWQPESPFTELEGEADAGYGEYEDGVEHEDETRAPISALSRMPVRIAQGATVPQPRPAQPRSAQPGSATPKVGSTAQLTAGRIFVMIQGSKSGAFPGNTAQKGREGWIAASGFAHEVKSPRDAATGQASGKRQYGALTLTLPWSSASPLVFNALVTNEILKSVVIEFEAALATGQEAVAQRVTLTNASASDLRRVNDRTQVNQGGPVEILALTFQKITIEDLLSSQVAGDDWSTSELESEEAGSTTEAEDWLGETYQLEDTGSGEYGPDGNYN